MEFSHFNPESAASNRKLLLACALTFVFFLAELFGGLWTKSLALIADSSHMGGDMLSLGFAWFVGLLARKPSNTVKTYGYHRLEVLAGILNAMALCVVSGIIFTKAFDRLGAPPEIKTGPMILIAALGLAVNVACIFILREDSARNQNVHGAYLHVLSDTLGSVGAIAGGLIMLWTGFYGIDPMISFVICLLIIANALRFLWISLNILLEGAPPHLNVEEIKEALKKMDGVSGVHDLHVWTLGGGMDMLTGHLEIAPPHLNSAPEIVQKTEKMLHDRFGIEHSTLQPERAKS